VFKQGGTGACERERKSSMALRWVEHAGGGGVRGGQGDRTEAYGHEDGEDKVEADQLGREMSKCRVGVKQGNQVRSGCKTTMGVKVSGGGRAKTAESVDIAHNCRARIQRPHAGRIE
jgi:hypothetical protein